ncbi:seven transmembrane MLO family protein [Actinidia rufa]|uniref:Seven transmembrane MLO family protein n=1 Tax=Actinidia rufa TaxID=165716 RepID=A0A7J0F3S7_9ERIC|nr:seven transmembrane MLO family protein [Actinidia rufa]
MAVGDSTVRSLEHTPTWAVAVVCFVIISVSIVIEKSIHRLTKWLKSHRKTALYDAVDRLKSELMLLGFMSLILAVTQEHISSICISNKLADVMLPCRKEVETENATVVHLQHLAVGFIGKLLPAVTNGVYNGSLWKVAHRRLADDDEEAADDGSSAITDSCSKKIMQIVYSVLTMALGRAKMRSWKAWEKETQTTEYQVENEMPQKCFFRQFFNSVAKVDYLTLRHGFIAIVLVLGTKLEVIVAKMALQLKNQNHVIIGTPLVQPHDDLFWFGQPRFVLTLLHLTLFVNAFELAFFIWVTIQFGFNSCYHEHLVIIITRLVLAVSVQVICSYITLPLYALVTQMGSEFKSKVLEEQVSGIIKQWHTEVRQKEEETRTEYSGISSDFLVDRLEP